MSRAHKKYWSPKEVHRRLLELLHDTVGVRYKDQEEALNHRISIARTFLQVVFQDGLIIRLGSEEDPDFRLVFQTSGEYHASQVLIEMLREVVYQSASPLSIRDFATVGISRNVLCSLSVSAEDLLVFVSSDVYVSSSSLQCGEGLRLSNLCFSSYQTGSNSWER